jgi:hypothetical protein
MTKFLMLYAGPATAPGDMTDEQVQTEMKLWGEWMEGIGSAMANVGNPTAQSDIVVDDGSSGTPLEISGYTIIEADDMAGAKELCSTHPFIRDETGKFSISIHELLDTPEM